MKITVDENLTIEGRDDSGMVQLTVTERDDDGNIQECTAAINALALAKLLSSFVPEIDVVTTQQI